MTSAAADQTELYQQIQQFYVHQFRLNDAGRAREWAETFTEDGGFAPNWMPEPIRGWDNLEAAALASKKQLGEQGLTRRHWLGPLEIVEVVDADTVRAECYAMVLITPRGGSTTIMSHNNCVDRLVRRDGRWLLADRVATRDDIS